MKNARTKWTLRTGLKGRRLSPQELALIEKYRHTFNSPKLKSNLPKPEVEDAIIYVNEVVSDDELLQQYYDGKLEDIELPHTHFPVQNSEWVLVRDGLNLPQVDQEILYVRDVRGSQLESTRNMLVRIADGDPEKITKHTPANSVVKSLIDVMFTLPTQPYPDQEVKHGWVDEIGYFAEMDEHFIVVRDCARRTGNSRNVEHGDYVTYWRPMVAPPPDTYQRSPFDHHQIWNIVQAKSVKNET